MLPPATLLSRYCRFALFPLAVVAAVSVVQGLRNGLADSQDFQWSPTVLLIEGKNPYVWYLSGNADGRIILSQQPNYLQLLYVLLVPFGLMGWTAAKCAWAILSLIAGALCAHLAARRNGLSSSLYFVVPLLFFCSTPFRNTIGNGQLGLFALLAFFAAWGARTNPAGGALLALGSLKYSFAPPLWLWMLLERRLSAVLSGLSLLAAGWLTFSWVAHASPMQTLLEPLQVGAAATGEGIGDILSLCRHLQLDDKVFFGFSYLCGSLVAIAAVAVAWRLRQGLDDEILFSMLCVAALGSFFHLAYDYVFLLPAFAVSLRAKAPARYAIWIVVGYFWFGLKLIDNLPIAKTALALTIHFAALVALFAVLASTKKKEMLVCGGFGDSPLAELQSRTA